MTEENHAISNARGWLAEIQTLVVKLNDDGLTDEQRDKVREEIEEGPLSVSVRSGWYSPGDPEGHDPEEYELLLSTGGPALRLVGGLDGGEPDDWARLEWQDWGTPWTEYRTDGDETEALVAYARCFYFGA